MKNVVGILLAFDDACDLKDLTDIRTVASLPFGGRYRICDFMISNMTNSKITSVGVAMKHKYQSLIEHLGNGKPWDLARKSNGLMILPPYSYISNGVADLPKYSKASALDGISDYIDSSNADYVVISDGNVVTNIDLEEVLADHIASDADITCVVVDKKVKSERYFKIDSGSNVVAACKECKDLENVYSDLGIYIVNRKSLGHISSWLNASGFSNFVLDTFKYAFNQMKIKAYVHNSFAAKIIDVDTFFKANKALLRKETRDELFKKNRPIFTKVYDEEPSYYGYKANTSESLIADGCNIEGNVVNSIIYRDVKIEEGANVINSIIFRGVKIGKKAGVANIICDKFVTISDEKIMAGQDNYPIIISRGTTI